MAILADTGINSLNFMSIQTNIQSVPTVVRRKAVVALVNYGFSLCAVATIVGYSISSAGRTLKRMNETGDVLDLPVLRNYSYFRKLLTNLHAPAKL